MATVSWQPGGGGGYWTFFVLYFKPAQRRAENFKLDYMFIYYRPEIYYLFHARNYLFQKILSLPLPPGDCMLYPYIGLDESRESSPSFIIHSYIVCCHITHQVYCAPNLTLYYHPAVQPGSYPRTASIATTLWQRLGRVRKAVSRLGRYVGSQFLFILMSPQRFGNV